MSFDTNIHIISIKDGITYYIDTVIELNSLVMIFTLLNVKKNVVHNSVNLYTVYWKSVKCFFKFII